MIIFIIAIGFALYWLVKAILFALSGDIVGAVWFLIISVILFNLVSVPTYPKKKKGKRPDIFEA